MAAAGVKRALRRIGVLAVLVCVLCLLPVPPAQPYQRAYNGLIAFVLIGGLGKILYDTLFYDHYHP